MSHEDATPRTRLVLIKKERSPNTSDEGDQEESPRKQTFRQWLLRQARRDDPVGDLARDFRQNLEDRRRSGGLEYPMLPNRITPDSLREHLEARGACDGAVEALERARCEWLTKRWRSFPRRRSRLRPAIAK